MKENTMEESKCQTARIIKVSGINGLNCVRDEGYKYGLMDLNIKGSGRMTRRVDEEG